MHIYLIKAIGKFSEKFKELLKPFLKTTKFNKAFLKNSLLQHSEMLVI